jgi:hypothetical protein
VALLHFTHPNTNRKAPTCIGDGRARAPGRLEVNAEMRVRTAPDVHDVCCATCTSRAL